MSLAGGGSVFAAARLTVLHIVMNTKEQITAAWPPTACAPLACATTAPFEGLWSTGKGQAPGLLGHGSLLIDMAMVGLAGS